MRFSAIFVAIGAITGVLAAPAATEARDANIVTVDSVVVDVGQMSAATADISTASEGGACGKGPEISCWVDIDYNSGIIGAMVFSDNQVNGDTFFGIGVCARKGFFNFGGSNNWFQCRGKYAAFLNEGLTVDGRKFKDGGVPTVAYYRVSDNTNYRLNFPPVGPLGKSATHLYYDVNNKITRMDSYGTWCI